MRILSLSPKESNPLWIGNQKYNKDFPVYKFLAEKSIHSISSSKQSFREDWQAMKISAESEYELAEKLLSGKSNKREWLHEYISLGINKGGPTSFSTLTNLRNMVQVYEQFNWLVWAVGYFYFQGELEDNNFGLPPGDNDAWVEGFTWKGVYFRLIPLQHSYLIKQEVEAIKHITLELEE